MFVKASSENANFSTRFRLGSISDGFYASELRSIFGRCLQFFSKLHCY